MGGFDGGFLASVMSSCEVHVMHNVEWHLVWVLSLGRDILCPPPWTRQCPYCVAARTHRSSLGTAKDQNISPNLSPNSWHLLPLFCTTCLNRISSSYLSYVLVTTMGILLDFPLSGSSMSSWNSFNKLTKTRWNSNLSFIDLVWHLASPLQHLERALVSLQKPLMQLGKDSALVRHQLH